MVQATEVFAAALAVDARCHHASRIVVVHNHRDVCRLCLGEQGTA